MEEDVNWINEKMTDFHGSWRWIFKVLSLLGGPLTYKKYYLFVQRLNEPFIGEAESKSFAARQMEKQYRLNNQKNYNVPIKNKLS